MVLAIQRITNSSNRLDSATTISFLKGHSHAVVLGSLDYVEGKLLFLGSGDGPLHTSLVVGVDPRIEASSGYRNITHAVVDQLGAAARGRRPRWCATRYCRPELP